MAAQSVESFVEDVASTFPEQYECLCELRKMTLKLHKSMKEEMKYGGILLGKEKHFCGIFVFKNHINLEFGEGAQFEDTYAVLEGSGKFRRHIKLFSLQDIANKKVKHYLKRAMDYADSCD